MSSFVPDLFFAIISLLSFLASLFLLGYLVITEWRAPKFIDSIKRKNEKIHENKENPSPLVSVIIPSRNEERMIAECLDSLLNQSHSNLEILVVDDSSTDKTFEIVSSIAKDFQGIRLISAGPKQEGWVGKSWPCWRGYEESKGEFILFVDADSTLKRKTIEIALRYFSENRLDVFSLSPRVKMRGVWAKSVLPIISGAINLLYPMQKVNDRKSERAYVFGTFILIRKSVYEATGGHKQVKGELVEDAELARIAKKAGYNLRVERGPEILSTVWEDDLGSIYSGLERVISNSIKIWGLVSMLNSVLLFLVILYPIIFVLAYLTLTEASLILTIGFIASICNIITFLALICHELNTISGKVGLSVLFYPLGCALFISAVVSASIKVSTGRDIKWKGQGFKQSTGR
ncbi:MAG: glycosyltransferase [Nitrososphaerales archaeon]